MFVLASRKFFIFFFFPEENANVVLHYHKLCCDVSHKIAGIDTPEVQWMNLTLRKPPLCSSVPCQVSIEGKVFNLA